MLIRVLVASAKSNRPVVEEMKFKFVTGGNLVARDP